MGHEQKEEGEKDKELTGKDKAKRIRDAIVIGKFSQRRNDIGLFFFVQAGGGVFWTNAAFHFRTESTTLDDR